jgi:putative transposase
VSDTTSLSIAEQCALLGISRSGLYYEPLGESALNLELMRLIDEQYLKTPFYGTRKLRVWLLGQGYEVNRKRIKRLMQVMRIEAIYQKPRTTVLNAEHVKYPYLLRDLAIVRPNQVWATDITYIPMQRGFLYLVAVVDWFSRYVLSWELSNSLDVSFCIHALKNALSIATPEIFNSDQGCQFTSTEFTGVLKHKAISISMDGKGRALDNIIVERLWRSVKYEEVYIKKYEQGKDAYDGLGGYFGFFNNERPHQSLGYRTPSAVYFEHVAKKNSHVLQKKEVILCA